jgi:hypothetical protein
MILMITGTLSKIAFPRGVLLPSGKGRWSRFQGNKEF